MENLRTEESFLARLPRGHDEEASTKLRYPFALLKIVTHFFNFKIYNFYHYFSSFWEWGVCVFSTTTTMLLISQYKIFLPKEKEGKS